MTHDQAERIGAYALDAGLDVCILPIERGDVYVVRIQQHCYFLWSFADWNTFCHERKRQKAKEKRKQQRRGRDERPAIDARQTYTLRMPVRA